MKPAHPTIMTPQAAGNSPEEIEQARALHQQYKRRKKMLLVAKKQPMKLIKEKR